MKLVKIVGIVVIVLVVVVVGGLYYYKDAAVRAGVTTGGNMVLGPGSTTLKGANLNVFGGGLKLTELQLRNPDGYKQPNFLKLAETDVSLQLGSLMSDKVVVPNVTLDGLQVVAETSLEQGLPKLNLITIKKTIDAAVGTPGTTKPAPKAEDGKKFVIQKLVITNMIVTGAVTLPSGISVPINVPVPSFEINGIGEKENGLIMKELVGVILDAIVRKAIEAVGSVGGIGLDMFQGGTDALLKGAGGLLQGAGGLGEGAGKAVGDILGGNRDKADGESGGGVGGAIEKGLGGLLGGDKKEEAPKQE